MTDKKISNLSPKLQGIVDEIKEKRQKREELNSGRTLSPKESVYDILTDVEERTKAISSSASLEIDPRRKFRKAIEIAKESRDNELIDHVYNFVIDYHEGRRYNYEAALVAAERGRTEKALSLIDKLVGSESNPDFKGALEIAEKLGERYKIEVQEKIDGIKSRQDDEMEAKDEKEREKFIGIPTLDQIIYLTRSGSRYQINEKGLILRNNEPFVTKGVSFDFAGVADRNLAEERMWDLVGYGSRYDHLNTFQAKYLANTKCPFLEEVKFEEIKGMLDKKVSLVGVNHDVKELFLTSPIVSYEEKDES